MTIGQLELYIFELMESYNNSVRAFAIEYSKQTEKIVKYPIMRPCFYGDSEIPEKHKAAKKEAAK
ncbi:MAG: hypothetical protein IJ740_18835 [Ruminococcus sp.]|nr:hypothetical protein [Ruminococcus sp.]MBR1752898.1 hypothetical protein [Ruminococcus sp.]